MEIASGSPRIQSVDALRGAIMILMALDHVRDFTNLQAMSFSPTDLSRTTAALFFTRWITHFCAPVFALTAGMGAFLWYHNKPRLPQLSRFLLTRGLWLVFLELTLLRFIFFFAWNWTKAPFILTVFWMLGLCMVVLALLVHVPRKVLAVLSLVVIATHNLLDPVSPERFGRLAPLWDMVHQQAAFSFHGALFVVAYPLVPWAAVMAAGFCLGQVLFWEAGARRQFLVRLGFGLTAAFLLLRLLNRYGDPSRWSQQSSALFTALSFLNTSKYPPSLLFLLMTLGPALVALAVLERRSYSSSDPLMVFGRVPFFFFLFHLALAHGFAVLLPAFRYGLHAFLLLPPPSLGGPRASFPSDYGFALPVVYLVWIAVVAASYPVCRWYADLKNRRRDLWWLSYL
jgi:uncharacterized membrane protein